MIKNISIIGAGSLTSSILSAISKLNHSYTITIIDINKNKKSMAKKYGVKFSSTYTRDITKADLILLVVKPKEHKTVLKKINKFTLKNNILISFMAGITHDQIKDNIDADVSIVRCMTNISIKNFKSFIFYFSKSLNTKNLKILQSFFSLFSRFRKCSTEDEIDKVTALYGSGPAYYVFFNEIIRDSFIRMGYSKKDSKELTANLSEGTAKLLEETNDSDKIINAIASKGGTTEAALLELKKNKTKQSLLRAINQAYTKSKSILKKS
tara:strand:- start:281 stop:1081 length:801 start_codon:yes stop_codon:yes gene_type:complete